MTEGLLLYLEVVMNAKITKAQKMVLRDIEHAERFGRQTYLVASYKPRTRLLELGLIEFHGPTDHDRFVLTKAGRDFLAKMVADAKAA